MKLMKVAKSVLLVALAVMMLAGCTGNPGQPNTQNPTNEPADPTAEPIDYTKLPYYVADYTNLTYSDEDYAAAISRPYWLGNVIYNELALPLKFDDGSVSATLMYTPLKVVCVKDQTLKVEYVEGKDYIVDAENGKLIIPEGSAIESLYYKADQGVNPPSGYKRVEGIPGEANSYTVWDGSAPFVYTESSYFYARYLSVTYVYDMSELDLSLFNSYDENVLPKTHAKIAAGEGISIVVFGDSISAGCSSTGDVLNTLPKTPGFVNQVRTFLKKNTSSSISIKNYAVGGTQSSYPFGDGKKSLDRAAASAPDLCIIAYGMNDAAGSEADYEQNIKNLMDTLKAGNPNIEFVLVNAFTSNPSWGGTDKFPKFTEILNRLAADENGAAAVVDIYPISLNYLTRKMFCEISSSNVNHPNDYFHRIYAMNIISVLIDFEGTK